MINTKHPVSQHGALFSQHKILGAGGTFNGWFANHASAASQNNTDRKTSILKNKRKGRGKFIKESQISESGYTFGGMTQDKNLAK